MPVEHGARDVKVEAISIALLLSGCHEDGSATEDDPTATDDGGDDGDDAADGSSGAVPFDDDPVCVDYGEPCTECEMAACPELFCDCYGEPDCGLLAQCVLACPEGSTECQAECAVAFPGGTSTSALLADCAAVSCEDECSALGWIPPPLGACERCVYGECGSEMDACAGVADCPTLLVCIAACGVDVLCQGTCAALYPGAVVAAQTVGNCSLAYCSEDCV